MPALQKIFKLLKRRAFASFCGVLTIGLLAIYFLRADLLDETRTESEQLQREAGNIKRNLRNAAGIQDQLSEMKLLLSIVDARLIRIDDIASNQQYFYRLESATGVKILLLRQVTVQSQASSQAGRPAGQFSYMPITFTVIVEGAFPQVMSFLTQLERGPHFNRTHTFTAQRGATDSPEGIRTGTVVVNLSVELLGIQ